MPASIRQLPEEPIIIVAITEPFNPVQDLPLSEQQFAAIIAGIDGPVYRIIDNTGWKVEFSELVYILDTTMRKERGADPRVHNILVSLSAVAAMGAKATAQEQYLGEETPVFSSLNEALAFVRAQLGQK